MQNNKKLINEHGATIVEMLAVLAILATISVGLYGGIASVMTKVKMTKAHQEVTNLVKSMRDQFSSFPPKSITAEKLAEVGIFQPGSLSEDKTKALNVYGTGMTITMGEEGVGTPYFTLTYESIAPQICTDLLLAEWGSDPSSGLKSIRIEGVATYIFNWDYANAKPGSATGPFPLSPDAVDAATACSAVASGSTQGKVSWDYYL